MYGYEELASYTSGDIRFNDSLLGLYFYEVKNTDKVIHAYEARIKELEAENKHLEDYIDAYQKSEAINIAKLDEKDKRIKELESIPHTDNTSVIDSLQNRIRKLLTETH